EIRVTATPPPAAEVTFTIAPIGGTAGPQDFGCQDFGCFSYYGGIGAGQSSISYYVSAVDDGLAEPDETVTFRITSTTGDVTLGARKETVLTIHNAAPTVEFLGIFSWTEDIPVVLAGFRRGDTNVAVTVDYATGTQGTAIPGVDFAPVAGQVQFAVGE